MNNLSQKFPNTTYGKATIDFRGEEELKCCLCQEKVDLQDSGMGDEPVIYIYMCSENAVIQADPMHRGCLNKLREEQPGAVTSNYRQFVYFGEDR